MSDSNAYLEGFQDARNYEPCEPEILYDNKGEIEGYQMGYGDGIEVCLATEGGICPDELRGLKSVVIANFSNR